MSGTVAWATGTDVMTTIGEDGCAEQHPAGWWEQITEAAKAAIGSGTAHPDQIAAVAVTGIWGSTVPVSGEGTPVGPCLLWLDSRGAPHARRYLEAVDYVSMCFTGTVAASPVSMTAAWLIDTRNPGRLGYDPDLIRMAGLDPAKPPLSP